ncbi:mannitol dehydrogenase family protein [Mesorhizobium sp. YIM 152430]|uniref:mannitol dehydrogenase family protein n=1 Tax=Mesorhizobium sp. YIM 152430 TaxID=3031761 RepID=UPI0023DB3BF5|nr:mannitol dehydrogenase family protein [Mesorhizobium sp. YIM 152430]MDF1601799.1 mannitol dehydrogenase family protein [Mesorhizobium sp. YIM 152430]
MSARLDASARLAADVALPAYVPEDHGCGIVHIGIRAFHKAHQAIYTDTALGLDGGDWRILGVSLRSREAATGLNPQDGRFLLLTRGADGDHARLIGSIAHVLVAPDAPDAVIAAIADPATRIVTVTVTEKAYGIDRSTGGLDLTHEAIAHDLDAPDAPRGVIGFLVAGLARRRATNAGPLTILCCDNLPENGHMLSRLVDAFARRVDPALPAWIDANIRFPSSMVDRITPAPTDRTLADADRMSGLRDDAAVETEPFSQWIIEDDFAAGRPAWEKAGALFVASVSPYEKMKLRMLNGAHSLIAYAGFLAGHETVADAMQDRGLTRIVGRQMEAAAATLPPVPGIDLRAYRDELLARFSNPAIRHLTYQIAMDGTEKLPQRIASPLVETLENGDADAFAFAIAAWMRYCMGIDETGAAYALRDPKETLIAQAAKDARRAPERLFANLTAIPGVFPAVIRADSALRTSVITHLSTMLDRGMTGAIEAAAQART